MLFLINNFAVPLKINKLASYFVIFDKVVLAILLFSFPGKWFFGRKEYQKRR